MNAAQQLAAEVTTTLPSREEYLAVVSDLINSFIPSDAIGWISLDLVDQTSEVAGSLTELADADAARWLVELGDDHPTVALYKKNPRSFAPRRMSDAVTGPQLRRTRAWRLLLRPVKARYQLSIPVARQDELGSRSRSWSLNRMSHDFSDAEVEMFRRLGPTLRLLDAAYAHTAAGPARVAELYSLTDRETEVLRLTGAGMTAVAIGHLLGISARTVAKHQENAYRRLGCNNKVSALRRLAELDADAPDDLTRPDLTRPDLSRPDRTGRRSRPAEPGPEHPV